MNFISRAFDYKKKRESFYTDLLLEIFANSFEVYKRGDVKWIENGRVTDPRELEESRRLGE
jgi:hypothetical protein